MFGASLAIILAGGLILACSDDAPTRAAKRRAQAPAVPVKEDTKAADTETAYRYDPKGKRDPFLSFVKKQIEDNPDVTPLERFDLTQLAVTGIIWNTKRPRALIEDPAGKGYIVDEGTVIGKNKGRVISIGDNTVTVKETYVDPRGRPTTKSVELRLRETQGG